MDSDLLTALRSGARDFASIVELTEQDGAHRLRALVSTYVADAKRVWLWEALHSPHKAIQYGDEDGLRLIRTLIGGNPRVTLFVSDDKPPPWPVFEGPLTDILALIGDQWLFEYALTDADLRWVIFDTHHNSLVVAGALIASSKG